MNKIRRKIIIFSIIPVLLVIAGIILISQKTQSGAGQQETEASYQIKAEENPARAEADFAKYPATKNESDFSGGIVPHHELASNMLAEFFSSLDVPTDAHFIILGPNHSDQAIAPAVSADALWQSLEGQLSSDRPSLERLIKSGRIVYDEEAFQKEHSIRVLTPYIKHYFPKARVTGIILTSKHDQEKSFALAQEISELIKQNPNTYLLASVDFSHYLPSSETEEYDRISLQAIENRDYSAISRFNSDYLDSPPAVTVFLKTMDLLECSQDKVVSHKNSADFLGYEVYSSTSYYSLIFY